MNPVFFMQDTGAVFGAERATIDLAAGLRQAGHRPLFFLIKEARLGGSPSGLCAALDHEGFEVTSFPVSGRISLSLARQLRTAFTAAGGDVLHVIGYKANLHAWLSGVRPRVATVHGWLFRDDPKERFYGALDRWCLRRCDRVVCLSSYYEALLLDKGVDRARLVRIPSGLRDVPAADRLPPVPGQPAAPVFGMLGRFSEEKNHAMFLRAASDALRRFPQARFLIAGQGPLEQAIRTEAARLGPAVEVTGYCDVNAFMPRIDAYVMCSRIENLPYSILEAMAWGRPVLATAVGGVPDLVVDGRTGALVDADAAAALAGVMTAWCETPERMTALGAAGRVRLLEEFPLARQVERHEALYASLRRS